MVRRSLQVVLLLLILLLVPLSLTAIWAQQVITNEDTYIAAVQDVPSNPDVQTAIADRVATQVSSRVSTSWETFVTSTVDNRPLQRWLLDQNASVYDFVNKQVLAFMQRPEFTNVWVEINKAAFPLINSALLGKDTGLLQATGGSIILDLQPVYDQFSSRLEGSGMVLSKVLPNGVGDLTFTLVESPSLATTQRIGLLIDRWAIPLAVVAAGLMLAVVFTARRRLYAGTVVGLVVLLGVALPMLAIWIAKGLVSSQHRGALAMIQVVAAELRTWLLWVGIASAVVMVVCLVAQFLVRRSPSTPSYR